MSESIIGLRRIKASMGLILAASWATLGFCAGDDTSPPDIPPALADFTENYCYHCHNDDEYKGRFDLEELSFDLAKASVFDRWVKVYDRLKAEEMPPKEEESPDGDERKQILDMISEALTSADTALIEKEGRAVQRRLNSYEYENALRDLFSSPWLQIRGQFPEDGESNRFNKIGGALDVSHVHISRYIGAADYALRQVLSAQFDRPPTTTTRHYARDQRSLTRPLTPRLDNNAPDRATFPLLDWLTPETEVRLGRAPLSDPENRDREAVGWVSSTYAGFVYRWDTFSAPVPGKYRIRFSGYALKVGPGGNRNYPADYTGNRDTPRARWPNFEVLARASRDEPISVYTERGLTNRRVGTFDLTPEPAVHDIGEVWLVANETLVPDPTRLFRSRPGWDTNPLMTPDGAPSVAFRWMEVEGPLYDDPIFAGYRLLFGELPIVEASPDEAGVFIPARRLARRITQATPNDVSEKGVTIISSAPRQDAERLLRAFIDKAYRRPVQEPDVQRFLKLYDERIASGLSFDEALLVSYTAVLVSPGFLFLDEQPGRLDDYGLATRLALFLWNSPPDNKLKDLAARGELSDPATLRSETERLLNEERASRFREAFLDYWLDLRKIYDSAPSTTLYNDYYLDDALVESAIDETRLVFEDMINSDRPARNIVSADFTYVNERLAGHYDIPGVKGVAMRRVKLPSESPRGGFLTQASVLKVTANGTTTSPVLRGNWIIQRILGMEIPLPPPVDAVEPDIRGAVTIRQQLKKHRADSSCAACHQKMDPPGFALESFDVMGGWRERYRGVDESIAPAVGVGKNGFNFKFHYGLPVDAAGELPDGRPFQDIREFKRLAIEDEKQLARNIAQQLIIYSTGSPIHFSDRTEIDGILNRASSNDYGIRTIIHEIVQSELFLNK